jgi:EmrB/QacA subfamily drug resistance transporter
VSITQSAPVAEPATDTGRLSRRAWATLLVLCGALFLDGLDVSMMGVALPSIRDELGMSTSALQWVVSGYVLGYGGFLLLGGRAADLLGRRRVFLIALAVFLVASGLSGLAQDGTFLIVTRFIKGISAAFTAPAGLSIITTTFAEGPARNKALSIYTATGATGFSLGLVFSGLLTDFGWQWVCFLPVPLAAITLAAAFRFIPASEKPERSGKGFDIAGAVSVTAAMLLLVYTVVEAPVHGWGSARTLGLLAVAVLIFAAFVVIERRTANPLVRLGILRSGALVRANLGAMTLIGGWFGAQFILTLYLQGLRGWSAIETGFAIFPAGLLVAILAPRMGPLVTRYGANRLILAGLIFSVVAYALFLNIELDTAYLLVLFPAFIFGGLAFGLAYGPLNIAATNGIAEHEQGLASGLVNTSFQFGGALVLAVVTAVNDASGVPGSPQGILDGFHAALVVPVIVAVLGVAISVVGIRRRVAAA